MERPARRERPAAPHSAAAISGSVEGSSLPRGDAATALAASLLGRLEVARSLDAWLSEALPIVRDWFGGDAVVLISAVGGQFVVMASAGSPPALPRELAADALDQERPLGRDGWLATPLAARCAGESDDATSAGPLAGEMTPAGRAVDSTSEPFTEPRETLLVHGAPPERLEALAAAAASVRRGLALLRQRARLERRVARLEAILEIAQQWNQAADLEGLLERMAEAATRLLRADRASIFLWDKAQHTLVARPALGVAGGELRVSDERGVVGQVIHSGRPRRVDTALEPREVDRQVDEQLGYHTRSLLCVPLRARTGEVFGAFELINKRDGIFTGEDEAGLVELAAHAAVALENAKDRQRLLSASRQIAEQAAAGARLIGESPAIGAVRSIVERLADADLAVLIQGENGTGKEVVARAIHYLSRRRDQPFVAVNCAAIPETLAESELFGHEKGAFTDAREARPGKFELAAEGTLFLDEIGDLSLAGQAKLLRVLEERVIVRVGGSRPIVSHARVLTATNQKLAEMVAERRFREDLFYRLNVVAIDLPPLRERGEDVLLLAEHFLADFCRKARRAPPRISPEARRRLLEHRWPGNVRELRNLMERLAYLSAGETIEAADLAFILTPRAPQPAEMKLDLPLAEATAQFQMDYIRRVIERTAGNMSQAAGRLGLHRSNLYRKMGQLGMPAGDESA